MFNIAVKIMPRPEVLDTQGRAVEKTLENLGYNLKSCSVGRYITLTVDAEDKNTALDKANSMAKDVLCNELIEQYDIEVL